MNQRTITNAGFLSEFARRHELMTDRPFCWVLGSGASVKSGIPSGASLVRQWLAEMHEMENGSLPIEKWATAKTLDIQGFEYERAANFYPWIYQRRFRDYKDQGYATLEKIMEKAEPSFGYSVLAQIMATTPHSVAVTTNFDNLIADALSIYTRTFPLVCGHESLTGYIRPNLRRPLIAKIHRDLLLAPLSNPEEISKLPGEWDVALKKIFSRFTPIVIGYGGNDGSLMSFLKMLDPIEGGIFWCHRYGSAIEPAVVEVVERHKGKLVHILGFDELMLQLQENLQLESLLPLLQDVHEKRVANYHAEFEALRDALKKPAPTPDAEQARIKVIEVAEAERERLAEENERWALATGKLSPGQSMTTHFPIVGERERAPWPADQEWSLQVDGLVARPLALELPELLRLPISEREWDTICVTGWTHFAHRWGGVMLADVLAVAQPHPEARFVRFVAHSPRNHDTSLPLEYAVQHVMLAHELDGQSLDVSHGGPLRSVCEGKYFYKSVKWLKRIELLSQDQLGFWERGSAYHNEADPEKEQRYEPKPLDAAEFERRVRERDFSHAFAIMDDQFATLRGTDLSGGNFEYAQIKQCKLLKMSLRDIRAANANFTRTIFVDSDLRDADLARCDLEGADFRGADLRFADLRWTFLTATQFADRHRASKIAGARFLRSDIDSAGLGDKDRQFLLDPANGAIIY